MRSYLWLQTDPDLISNVLKIGEWGGGGGSRRGSYRLELFPYCLNQVTEAILFSGNKGVRIVEYGQNADDLLCGFQHVPRQETLVELCLDKE